LSKKQDSVFAEYARKPTVRIPTNILLLDVLLNGGIPPGDYVEICSQSGLGKSTMVLQIAKRYARDIGWVLILDHEQGITDEMTTSMKMDEFIEDGSIIILQPITYEDSQIILDSLDQSNLPSLIIIDSVTSMLPDKSAVGVVETKKQKTTKADGTPIKPKGKAIGVKSRQESDFLLKYKGWARKKDITFIFINQTRMKFTKQFIAYEDSAGGNALKFYTDIRLFMRKTIDLKREENTINGPAQVIYGNTLEIVAKKNRGNRSHIPISVDVVFGKGVSNIKSVANILLAAGLVEQRGASFVLEKLGEDKNVRGWAGLMGYIKDHGPELKEKVKEIGKLALTGGGE